MAAGGSVAALGSQPRRWRWGVRPPACSPCRRPSVKGEHVPPAAPDRPDPEAWQTGGQLQGQQEEGHYSWVNNAAPEGFSPRKPKGSERELY